MSESRKTLTRTVLDGAEALRLARSGSAAALERLRDCSPDELAAAVQELPAVRRAEFLELSERVEEIVPLLPETELTSMIRAVGLADAGWLVEFASPEQRIAAVDLDCWKDFRFSPMRLFEWIDAMIEAGPETLAAALDELDPEVWVLAMKEMADFSIAGMGDAVRDEFLTEDGSVFYTPHSAEHEDRLREILSTALIYSPSHYWRFVYGAIFEGRQECLEYAARWHAGRLNDLGFPNREYAMNAYRPLRPDAMPAIDVKPDPEAAADDHLASSHLPEPVRGTALGRALSELSAERASEILGYVLAVANTLAVADELPLAEPESVATSLTKALRGVERGLVELARARNERPAKLLNEVVPLDLFRIGATVDPDLGRGKSLTDLDAAQSQADWNELIELISEADQTLGRDGRPKS
ncbi:MAG: hypothetical protein JRG92_20830 [Deltaproteobacteria bacterium]|nr:hypothetical protein [Deltaproteobacteria bacterium]MBW2386085.1 hypothetical protein [Deltaproteobacteria bacterium]MBW2698810.1 hypothetical protein [Deltaproteobacteria bacterium]